MKILTICITWMIILLGPMLAISSELDVILLIKDNSGASQILHFGLDPAATDTLDVDLGERELPPFPPGGVFEARFVGDDIDLPQLGQGCYKDYRAGDVLFQGTKTHELKYQPGAGTEITIIWDLPENITGLLQDFLGGVVVNKEMRENDSLLITNPGALNKLKMTMNYSGLPLAPALESPFDGAAEISPDSILIWNASNAASAYTVQVAKSSDFSTLVINKEGLVDTVLELTNLEYSTAYYWRINAQNINGTSDWSEVWRFTTVTDTRIFANQKSSQYEYELLQNYPNPFNPATTIEYQMPTAAYIQIAIYDMSGKKVRILVSEKQAAGHYAVVWDGCNTHGALVSSGAYLVRMVSHNSVHTRKIIVLK